MTETNKSMQHDLGVWSQTLRPASYPSLSEILAQRDGGLEREPDFFRILDGRLWSFERIVRWNRLSTTWMLGPKPDPEEDHAAG